MYGRGTKLCPLFVIFVGSRFFRLIMKFVRYIYITLLYSLIFSVGQLEAEGQTRKKRPSRVQTQKVSKPAHQSSKRRKVSKRSQTTQAQRRTKSTQVRSSAAGARSRTVSLEAVRQERRYLDSLRLHNGGVRPLAPREELLPVDIEPLMARFRRGDTTLRSEVIAQLYYSNHAKRGVGSFLHQMEVEADGSIASSRYAEALRTVRRGLLRNPMYFALIKRACDLALHEGDPEVDIYLWQLVELFVVVEGSGDGKTPKTALNVMGVSDALLFEMLWMETPSEEIRRREPVTIEGGKQLLVLEIGSQDKKILRHYRMPKSV